VVGLHDTEGCESVVLFFWFARGRTNSKGLESFFGGTLPIDAILFKAGGCPVNGGGVVLPSKAVGQS